MCQAILCDLHSVRCALLAIVNGGGAIIRKGHVLRVLPWVLGAADYLT